MKASLPFKYILPIRKAKTMLSLISRTTVASVRENGSRPICLLTVLIKH